MGIPRQDWDSPRADSGDRCHGRKGRTSLLEDPSLRMSVRCARSCPWRPGLRRPCSGLGKLRSGWGNQRVNSEIPRTCLTALCKHGSSGDKPLDDFSRHGYSVLYWDEEHRRLGTKGDGGDEDRENYVACRDVEALKARLKSGPEPIER